MQLGTRLTTVLAWLVVSSVSAIAQETAPTPLPDWSQLDPFQQTLHHGEFRWLLDSRYAPGDAWRDTITLKRDRALIATAHGPWALHFAETTAEPPSAPPTWQPKPSRQWHIALDPGHIGGDFAELEGRSWQVGQGSVFREGDAALEVALRAKTLLEAAGIRVSLLRSTRAPVTQADPDSFTKARDFTVGSEIQARAARVNNELKPDCVIAIHFNAIGWEKPPATVYVLTEENHAHILVAGSYSAEELSDEAQRFAMLQRLLNGWHRTEDALAESYARQIPEKTSLAPFSYSRRNAYRAGSNPYIWSRNLLANRIYACPVVYLELWVANSRPFYQKWSADPDAIYRTYAEVITQGILAHLE